jgi:hypothetical protein
MIVMNSEYYYLHPEKPLNIHKDIKLLEIEKS